MDFVKKLEFGNYTLNFGERKVLLDLFDQVVMPSFFEMRYVRSLKEKGEYFFWIQSSLLWMITRSNQYWAFQEELLRIQNLKEIKYSELMVESLRIKVS